MHIVFYTFATQGFNQAWIYPHWKDELTRAGHTFTIVSAEEVGTDLSRDQYDDRIVETVTREHRKDPVSLFLSSVRSPEMSREAVQRIRDLSIPTVNVTWDDTLMAHRVKEIASASDLYWIADPLAMKTMRGYGANALFLPSAANPHVYRPHDVDEDKDVSFCGQRYGSRIFYIEELFRRGIEVELFGVGWLSAGEGGNPNGQQRGLGWRDGARHLAGSLSHPNGRTWARATLLRRIRRRSADPDLQAQISKMANPPLPGEEMIQLFSRSKLSLGFNELGHTYLLKNPLSTNRTRDFEAVASGACHFIRRMPEWAPYFEEDREVLCYDSADELADKIHYYLDPKRDAARTRIRQNARERAVAEHTWTHRFDEISRQLGIKAA